MANRLLSRMLAVPELSEVGTGSNPFALETGGVSVNGNDPYTADGGMATVNVARFDRAVTVSNFGERIDLPRVKSRPGETLPNRYGVLTSLRLLSTPPNRSILAFKWAKYGSSISREELAPNVEDRALRDAYHWYLPQALPDKGPQGGKNSAAASGSPFDRRIAIRNGT